MKAEYILLTALLYGCGAKTTISDFQIRVVWGKNPQTKVRIVWTEDIAHSNSHIEFGGSPYLGGVLLAPDAIPSHQQYNNEYLFEANNNPYVRSATFKDLQPGTSYYFRISNHLYSSEIYSFITAPAENNYAILFGGDSRSNIAQRRRMNRIIAQYIQEHPEVIALVHGGDYVADGSDWRQWNQWINDFSIIQDHQRILPIIPTRGNHETDLLLYQQIFGMPTDEKTYFSTQLPYLSIVTLDSELSILGDQYTWLEDQLAKAKEDDTSWIFTNYHRPAYPAVKQADATKKWVPVFEKYGVNIAFESDGHTFKRTAPLWQESINAKNGIIYMGEGGLGVKLRQPQSDRWYLNGGGTSAARYHFIVVNVDATSLRVQSIDHESEIFDDFSLQK